MKCIVTETFPTGCWVKEDDWQTIMSINLTSRIANKVYRMDINTMVTDFDTLFSLTTSVDWRMYIGPNMPFTVSVITKNSQLHATRSIQSVVHKAIISQLTQKDAIYRSTTSAVPIEILVFLENDHVSIGVNTSGTGLHQRGWRKTQGIAPLKENLAAATILSASRPFSQPLRDPCCGSGTLVIEAARLARNILAGQDRVFAFQSFPSYDKTGFMTTKKQYQEMIFPGNKRTLVGSDKDPAMIEKARYNAKEADVDDIVTFVEHDILSKSIPSALHTTDGVTLVANPPYDKRLTDADVDGIHARLATLLSQPNRHGAVISGYDDALHHFGLQKWKRKETRNGKDVCYIWIPKGN